VVIRWFDAEALVKFHHSQSILRLEGIGIHLLPPSPIIRALGRKTLDPPKWPREPQVAIWDMTGREAMLLQISSKALWSR
jgi:hypothetical protein